MEITLLCNAGLALRYEENVLLIDLPNGEESGFCRLPDDEWKRICSGEGDYGKISGICFTHIHKDHYDASRLKEFTEQHKDVPCFVPKDDCSDGVMKMGAFTVEYHRFEHAPIENAPLHMVFLVSVGNNSFYIVADAALDCEKHREILNGRTVDTAFWTPMYLSRQDTRILLKEAAVENYIYHMPVKAENCGIWKKCENNFRRYGEELKNTIVPDHYPCRMKI